MTFPLEVCSVTSPQFNMIGTVPKGSLVLPASEHSLPGAMKIRIKSQIQKLSKLNHKFNQLSKSNHNTINWIRVRPLTVTIQQATI